jgi:hypothetical protein
VQYTRSWEIIGMSKPIDYYAGYPNQQGMPKWVGITLGSLFGGMLLIAVAVGARLLWPARTAEASVARPAPAADQPILAPVAVPKVAAADKAAADTADEDDAGPATKHHHHHHGKQLKHGKAVAMLGPSKHDAKYQHAQLFAKHVSTGSRHDKKSRDDLDKLLGL